ncbi:MAG: class I SAM-dependent methyltransferase [Nitrososphaerota archaeon]|nr:class I SAM-dependent methyltransferase [Nitrososphaerota archaeon]MDG6931080.1 class I SAM-dependent methyltransferase [Nitrososphaerota archaeon]
MPSPADKELKSVYNEIASSYDRANSFISFYQDGRLRKELVKMLVSIKTPCRALDVGAGNGELSRALNKISPKTEIVMIDYAEDMLNMSEASDNRVIASFTHLPFRDESFDAVMSSFALHAADDLATVVSEMSRVSRNTVGALAMGKPDSAILRKIDGFYLKYVQPNLAALAGAKPENYRYIYYIFCKNPTNSEIKDKIIEHVELIKFKQKALNAFYMFVGIRKQ